MYSHPNSEAGQEAFIGQEELVGQEELGQDSSGLKSQVQEKTCVQEGCSRRCSRSRLCQEACVKSPSKKGVVDEEEEEEPLN